MSHRIVEPQPMNNLTSPSSSSSSNSFLCNNKLVLVLTHNINNINNVHSPSLPLSLPPTQDQPNKTPTPTPKLLTPQRKKPQGINRTVGGKGEILLTSTLLNPLPPQINRSLFSTQLRLQRVRGLLVVPSLRRRALIVAVHFLFAGFFGLLVG